MTDEPVPDVSPDLRSEEHTSELQSRPHLVCRLLLEKKKQPRRAAPCRHSACAASRPDSSATTAIPTLSLHDALPISQRRAHDEFMIFTQLRRWLEVCREVVEESASVAGHD